MEVWKLQTLPISSICDLIISSISSADMHVIKRLTVNYDEGFSSFIQQLVNEQPRVSCYVEIPDFDFCFQVEAVFW